MAIQTLRCPHCSAPLTRDAEGKDPVECPYCHSALTSNKPIIVVNGPADRPTTPKDRVVTVLVIAGIAAFILLAVVLGRPTKVEVVAAPVVVNEPPPLPPAPVKPPEPPSPVKEVLKFGEGGTNPGQLSHANHLAVAADGSFFVGENSTGRMQKFDAEGKYVDVVTMPPDKLTKKNGIFGMAADAKGNVYVNRVGDVLVYDAATLKLVREIDGSYPDRYFHGGIAIDGAGNVLVLADRTGDLSLFTLSSAGKVLGHQKTYASDVAVDGTGRQFLVGDDGLEVRDAKGAVLSKVGVKGNRVAFDGKGHVYVVGSSGVEVVSAEGTKVASLPVRAEDIGFDAKGRLVALDGEHVTVWEVTLP